MRLNSASLAIVVGAGKRYFLAVGIDAHPIDGFIVVAVEVYWMVDVKLTQHSLKIHVLEVFFLHGNKNNDIKFISFVLLAVLIMLFICIYHQLEKITLSILFSSLTWLLQ